MKDEECCQAISNIDPKIEKLIQKISKKLTSEIIESLCKLARERDPQCPHGAWIVSCENHSDYPGKTSFEKVRCRICNNVYSFSSEGNYWKFVGSHGLEHAKKLLK